MAVYGDFLMAADTCGSPTSNDVVTLVKVTYYEREDVGFDRLSQRGMERRRIEVKGRVGVGHIELAWSEFAKPYPRFYRVQASATALAEARQLSLDVRFRVRAQPVIETSVGARA
ncbi:MAG: hypothetical protein ACRDZO_05835 [Egibacteraceae bacterium]